jgi:hypothetical protein
MCLSKNTVCRRRLLLFLLAGFLLCLFRFLSHVALRDPKVGSMQVDLDMHKYRVHHNCKIDTACFEEGKRRSHRSRCGWANLSHDAPTRYVDTGLAQLKNFRTEIDMEPRPLMESRLELRQFCSDLWRAPRPKRTACLRQLRLGARLKKGEPE